MIRLMSRENEICKYALTILLKRIVMFDIDKRFEKKRERIAEYFLPLLFDFIDDFDKLKEIWSINIRNEIDINLLS